MRGCQKKIVAVMARLIISSSIVDHIKQAQANNESPKQWFTQGSYFGLVRNVDGLYRKQGWVYVPDVLAHQHPSQGPLLLVYNAPRFGVDISPHVSILLVVMTEERWFWHPDKLSCLSIGQDWAPETMRTTSTITTYKGEVGLHYLWMPWGWLSFSHFLLSDECHGDDCWSSK